MPFRSEAQRKYLFANDPAVAEEFAAHTPKGSKLPKKVGKSSGKNVSKSGGKKGKSGY